LQESLEVLDEVEDEDEVVMTDGGAVVDTLLGLEL